MADATTTTTKYLTQEGLKQYNTLIRRYIDDTAKGEDITAKSFDDANLYKKYVFYKGGEDEGKELITINIPKDLVVESGSVVKITTADESTLNDGQAVGTYIKLQIKNQDTPLYIDVKDLIDIYEAKPDASQVQIKIEKKEGGDGQEISATIVAGSIGTTELAAGSVTDVKIATDAVIEAKIRNGAVTENKIAATAVTTEKIAATAVTKEKIADSAVIEDKIADSAVTINKIADLAVTNDKIANTTIQTGKIVDGAITTNKIADKNVTNAKIANGAVTRDKIASEFETQIADLENFKTNGGIAEDDIYSIFNESFETDYTKDGTSTHSEDLW